MDFGGKHNLYLVVQRQRSVKHVDDQVAVNKANIADNTDKIGKSADAIADNKQK